MEGREGHFLITSGRQQESQNRQESKSGTQYPEELFIHLSGFIMDIILRTIISFPINVKAS